MAMHPAYRTHCKPARRGLAAVICAVLLLLSGAALAHGAVAGAEGSSGMPATALLWAWGEMFVKVLLVFATPVAVALALNWGAQALWKAAFRTQPPFGLNAVAALVVSLMLAAFSVYVIPVFAELFASFGAHLPWQTEVVMNYGYLLPGLVILMLFLMVALKNSPCREGYFALILIGELAVLVFSVLSMYPTIHFGVAA